jgi:uroporphyrinogen-III synthase
MAALDGLRVLSFEARRADELATMLARHGADVVRAPALRETALDATPEASDAVRRIMAGEIAAVVLLTGVGTKAWAAAVGDRPPRLVDALGRVPIVARGPKPVAALRELGVSGAHPVPPPHTWREALGVIESLNLPVGARLVVQEYGVPPVSLHLALGERRYEVVRVPVYRWALPADPALLRAGAEAVARGECDVAVFTNGAQVEHLFRVASAPDAVRAGLERAVVASVGPICTEALEAHGVVPDLEASPPKMGPLVALVAAEARAALARKRPADGAR